MSEYFTHVNPRFPDRMRCLVTTFCNECFVDIVGVRDDETRYSEVSLGLLSSHAVTQDQTFRGRLRLAWAILRGEFSETVTFSNREQVHTFTTQLLDITHRVFDPPTIPPTEE